MAVIDGLTRGQAICLQIVFQRTTVDWRAAASDMLFDRRDRMRFPEFENEARLIREKLDESILGCSVRLLATGASDSDSVQLIRQTAPFFRQYASAVNELVPLCSNQLDRNQHISSFLGRYHYRKGMLLSMSEVTGLVSLPSQAIATTKLLRDRGATRAIPETVRQGDVLVGRNTHLGLDTEVRLSSAVHSSSGRNRNWEVHLPSKRHASNSDPGARTRILPYRSSR